MENNLGYTTGMGPLLRAEVERQLLQDFQRYVDTHWGIDLAIDWSDTCPEGHTTAHLDGCLENWSDVWIVNAQGKRIAWGWIEFIHGRGENALFVFWTFLHRAEKIEDVENTEDLVRAQGIPLHVWESLPTSAKDLCLTPATCDAAWENDPLVLRWREQSATQPDIVEVKSKTLWTSDGV